MDLSNNKIRSAFLSFANSRTQEELDVFGATTYEDVQRTIAKIQSRQGTDRTLMDLRRVQPFLHRVVELNETIRTLGHPAEYVAFVWGPLKAIFTAVSQDQKALDILLDAFEQFGNAIPVLRGCMGIFNVHRELRMILDQIYQHVLQFQEEALRLSTHPSKPRLEKLTTLADSCRHAHTVQVYVERLRYSVRSQTEESGGFGDGIQPGETDEHISRNVPKRRCS